jgi:hypothetical protein
VPVDREPNIAPSESAKSVHGTWREAVAHEADRFAGRGRDEVDSCLADETVARTSQEELSRHFAVGGIERLDPRNGIVGAQDGGKLRIGDGPGGR